MFGIRRLNTRSIGPVVAGLVGIFAVLPAQSRSSTGEDATKACAVRVAELEAEVRALREQLHQQSGKVDAATACRPGSGTPRADSAAREASGNACNPPYAFDPHGIKQYKPACLLPEQPTSACTNPYEYTEGGIKIYKPQCVATLPSGSPCDPPYLYDASGAKRYKPECLK
jgi:hypothetical protein